MDNTARTDAISLLDDARIDPVIVSEIIDSVLDGFEDDAVERLLEELNVTEDQAQAIYEHLRDVLPGDDLEFEEIPLDLVPFVAVADMPTSGNPFVRRTAYFVRRGVRVFSAFPVKHRDGVDGFHLSGSFHPAAAVSQIWRTVPSRKSN